MTTKVLIKRIERLEKQVRALQQPKKLKPILKGFNISETMLKEAKKMWMTPPKFITK